MKPRVRLFSRLANVFACVDDADADDDEHCMNVHISSSSSSSAAIASLINCSSSSSSSSFEHTRTHSPDNICDLWEFIQTPPPSSSSSSPPRKYHGGGLVLLSNAGPGLDSRDALLHLLPLDGLPVLHQQLTAHTHTLAHFRHNPSQIGRNCLNYNLVNVNK